MRKNVLRGVCAAALAMLAGMLAHYAWEAGQRDVPDRPAVPVVEQTPPDQLDDSPTRGTASPAVPPAVQAGGE